MNALIEILNLWGTRFTAFALPMLAQSAVLAALLFAIDAVLRHRVRATVRYALWMLLLVKLLLPPTLMSPTGLGYWVPQSVVNQTGLKSAGLPSTLRIWNNLAAATPAGETPLNLSSTPTAPAALTGSAILFIIWLGALGGLAVWVGWQIRSVVHILRDTTGASAHACNVLYSCCEQLGIKRAISLRYTTAIGSPAICGFFRPVILIPASLPEKLAESELRSVLLHELAHFRRGDLWVGHAQIVLQLFYWYNPLLWFANRMIQRIREQAVDEMVLVEMRDEADAYPETLLQVARLTLARPAFSLGLVGILEPAGGLKDRIQHILRRPFPTSARIGIRGSLLVATIALIILPMACKKNESSANTPPAPDARLDSPVKSANTGEAKPVLARMGQMNLTGQQANELEAKVAANPEDLDARSQLLGHYFMAQQHSDKIRQIRQGHILWIIEHHPEANVLSPAFVGLIRHQDGSAYVQGQTLWLKQAQAHPKDLAILEHAADYLLVEDRANAEKLLKQAQAIEPDNAHWDEKLAQLYGLNVQSGDRTAAAKAVAELEKAGTNSPESMENLIHLAKMSYAAGDMEKAKASATELLRLAPDRQYLWDYGNAIHDGNLVLGRVALHDGNIEAAKKYLLEAGKTPGSPQLNSSGPNMSLANDLLNKGEKDTVVAYFQLCGNFWTLSRGPSDLKTWTEEVKAGQIPHFGGNLYY